MPKKTQKKGSAASAAQKAAENRSRAGSNTCGLQWENSTRPSQATQPITASKKWQLQNFAFLKAHIAPRTYTVETTRLQETGEQSEDEESIHSIPTRPASPSPSTSAAARKTNPPASEKSKNDDLLMKFLDRPRPRGGPDWRQLLLALPPPPPQPDERTAFSQWIAARMSGINATRPAAVAALPAAATAVGSDADMAATVATQRQDQLWGASTQVQQPSQQVWQQLSSSSQPQIQLLDAPLHPPAIAQPVRQTPELQLGVPRSQSAPPLLDSSITASGLTDLFMKQLTQGIPSGNTSQVAASQAASPSGTQEDAGDD